jgi:phage pi2 protein 07
MDFMLNTYLIIIFQHHKDRLNRSIRIFNWFRKIQCDTKFTSGLCQLMGKVWYIIAIFFRTKYRSSDTLQDVILHPSKNPL